MNTEHFKICDFVIFFNLFFSQGPAAPAEMPGLRKPESPLKEFDKVGFKTSGRMHARYFQGILICSKMKIFWKDNNLFIQAELKERLTPTQYLVTQEHQTEKYAKPN